jgi:hypothetical protein
MTKFFAVVGCLASTSVFAVPIFNPDNGHYYDVVQAPGITWDAARAQALGSFYSGLQGHLATITSAQEHDYVNQAIIANGGGEMWAGGYQDPTTTLDKQANWTWVNGEGAFPGFDSTTPYAKWNPGEPNDAPVPGFEQYLGLNRGPGFNDEGNLSLITGYVIEYDPNTIDDVHVPDGGATAGILGGSILLLAGMSRRVRR